MGKYRRGKEKKNLKWEQIQLKCRIYVSVPTWIGVLEMVMMVMWFFAQKNEIGASK